MGAQSRRTVVTGLVAMPILVVSTGCGLQSSAAAEAQSSARSLRRVEGCEGCEAVWEREPAKLRPVLVLADQDEPGERLVVRGTVFHSDASTPARNVIVYAHHTNAAGRYANGSRESEWSRRHGRLRGWLMTGSDGRYEIQTIKPAPYPERASPAHIHLFILEPGKADPYWIDDIVFAGEFGVTPEYRMTRANQGGPGIVQLAGRPVDGFEAVRDIVLTA